MLAFAQVGRALELALQAAAPAGAGADLAGIVLGWLSRAAPSLPFVALALPIRSFLGIVLVLLSLATLAATLSGAWGTLLGDAEPRQAGILDDLESDFRGGPVMSEDRTQPPSKRRRQLARQQGQVAHSPELTAAGGWLAAVVLLGCPGRRSGDRV